MPPNLSEVDKKNLTYKNALTEKGKPVERQGRKVTGLPERSSYDSGTAKYEGIPKYLLYAP